MKITANNASVQNRRSLKPEKFYSGFSDKLKAAALRAAPTDKAFVFSAVGLNLSGGDKNVENFILRGHLKSSSTLLFPP